MFKTLCSRPADAFALNHMSHAMRKPVFCICENKGADQLCVKHAADQGLCFCYIDSTIPLLPMSEIFSDRLLWLFSPICVGPGWKPRRQVFWRCGAYEILHKSCEVLHVTTSSGRDIKILIRVMISGCRKQSILNYFHSFKNCT